MYDAMRLLLLAFCLLAVMPRAARAENTIRKDTFNFGHQLGYLYSRMDDAYFAPGGTWYLETGVSAYYTAEMPLVTNPAWKERLLLQAPFEIGYSPADSIDVRAESDFVAEFPYRDRHSVGGNSPRFRTRIRLLREGETAPALAFTVGVKFSSAKPYNIWDGNLNYEDSNGLAGVGTGVTDYFMLFTASKQLGEGVWSHARVGLAPVGDPTAFERGSSQADQIPYGLSFDWLPLDKWGFTAEVAGMWGAITTTNLDHYSVARLQVHRLFDRTRVYLNVERGLTRESDDWVVALRTRFYFGQEEAGTVQPYPLY